MKIETGTTRDDNSAAINCRDARIDIHNCATMTVEHDSEHATTIAIRTDRGEVLEASLFGLPDALRAALIDALPHGRRFSPAPIEASPAVMAA